MRGELAVKDRKGRDFYYFRHLRAINGGFSKFSPMLVAYSKIENALLVQEIVLGS